MRFDQLQQSWEELGEQDPLWAILSVEEMKGNKWKLDRFFETGVEYTSELATSASQLGLSMKGTKALDFGCGVGRLTQALAAYYDQVTGVDISAPMIEQANRLNPRPDHVDFVVNAKDDLSIFGDASFDYVQTFLVLQHMHPRHQAGYLREFTRILKPGGLLIFQVPSYDRRNDALDQNDGFVSPEAVHGSPTGIRMFVTPLPLVVSILDEAGMEFVGAVANDMGGIYFGSVSYYFTRRENSTPVYRAVDGFLPTMNRIVDRTMTVLHEDSRYVGIDLRQSNNVDLVALHASQQEIEALKSEVASLKQEQEALLNSKTWRMGRRLAAMWHRLPGVKSGP